MLSPKIWETRDQPGPGSKRRAEVKDPGLRGCQGLSSSEARSGKSLGTRL